LSSVPFGLAESAKRCVRLRRRILEISQQVQALHISSAFSCTEIVQCIYFHLMRPGEQGGSKDTFLMSKGHGCMIQYVCLEELGILTRHDLDRYCTADGILGCHPDYGTPGIEASTGSLGHGMAMAVGMSLAAKGKKIDSVTYVVLSDGELQEGSTWEALMMASSLGCSNLVAVVDNNDFQSLGRTSETHPSFYPIGDKLDAFGWEVAEIDGHDSQDIYDTISSRSGDKPLFVVAKTTKGKPISYMENVPIWHYRSPSIEEYQQALAELATIEAEVER
jgi:transketolase